MSFSQAAIDGAVAAPLIAFGPPTESDPRPGTAPEAVGAANALYYLALVNYLDPGTRATGGTTVESALLAQVTNLVSGGKEPDADGGLEGWSHNGVAQALLLVKSSAAIWDRLSKAEQAKVTLLEAALGYAGNYTYNDANDFRSGICGSGDFKKTDNPNYADGYVDVEIAAIQYFGGIATWDGMLAAFDDAGEVSVLGAAGLSNAAGCFQKVGSAADSAIRQPWTYSGSGDPLADYGAVSDASWSKPASATGPAGSGSGVVSGAGADPVAGQCCMSDEFDTTDSSGVRSSALYGFEEAMNLVSTRATMVALGTYGSGPAGVDARMDVGMTDLIWKLTAGYYSQALGQSHLLTSATQPSSDGPGIKGYAYVEDIWLSYLGAHGS